MSWEFLITTFILVASPGTGVVYTLAAGLSRGSKASVLAALSCTLGILPHLTAAMLGLAAVLHASAVAFNILKFAGIVYLLFMAWQMLKDKNALNLEQQSHPRTLWRLLLDGILLNLLNPKLSIFFVAFLPQFIHPQEAHPMQRMAELSGVFMLITFVVFAFYGIFASLMRKHVVSRPAVLLILRRSFAAAFVALAAKLVLTEK